LSARFISSLSIVIPVFNATPTIDALSERLLPVLRGMNLPFEVIFVNDGSRDDSWTRIDALTRLHAEVVGIDLRRNYGQHNALLCGIRAARHDVIVTMDDDLQQPPEEIPKLLGEMERTGCDVVYGTTMKEQHGLWRNVAARATRLALRSALGPEIAPLVSTFRAFRTDLRSAFDQYRSPLVSIDVLLSWATNRFTSVRVIRHPRYAGRSNYGFGSLLRHLVNMVTGFSVLPLQIATIIGFVFMLFGIAVLVFVMARYLIEGDAVPGFPFLASIVALFSGAQLFALGIIGEYLGHMHLRTIDRPPYVVRESTAVASDDARPRLISARTPGASTDAGR
jgi:undecaprenyl-phosphate 4-deoxy-4-formamido-L-arabinose transferase